MLRNYLSVALRHFRRAPIYTLTNVTGLAVGIGVCTLIGLFVMDELGYDRHHENGDRIARVIEERTSDEGSRRQAVTPPGLAAALLEVAPAVERATRFYSLGDRLLSADGETQVRAPMMYLADSTVFEVFTLPLVS